jgi:hypothetical protein
MLRYYRFSDDIPAPEPARDAYVKREPGRGWPEECPPVRAANGFGWDVRAPFDMVFRREAEGGWTLEEAVEVESDWVFGGGDEGEGEPLTQVNAWFWERGQTLPHPISDHVYEAIRNQVKVSTYLFLWTDANECLLFTDVPGLVRPWRAHTALVDTDWYPASYPWHCVLELDARHERIEIPAGEPICRIVPLRRDTYFAREADEPAFEACFRRSQAWIAAHGKGQVGDMTDIRGAYARQHVRSRFVVGP